MTTSITGIGPESSTQAEAKEKTIRANDMKKAAQGLEAYFMRQLLSQIQPEGGSTGGGQAAGMYREMFNEALADAMAEGGGFGLAKSLGPQLGGDIETTKTLGSSVANAAMQGKEALSALAPTRHALTIPSLDGLDPATVVTSSAVTARLSASRAAGLDGALGAYARRSAMRAFETQAQPLTTMPIEGSTSSPFGERLHPIDRVVKMHAGMDLAAPEGTAIRAAGAGTVIRAENAGGYGNLVVIDHGGGVETRYAHMSALGVRVGDRVEPGALVGNVGQTGHATGPHLHFEVRRNGQPVDPADEISGLKSPK